MPVTINTKPYPPQEVIPDFGWYYGGSPPVREPEYTYTANQAFYPPGHTTTAASVTASTPPPFDISVTSTASFDVGSGCNIVINNGTHWSLFSYESVLDSGTFHHCILLAGTRLITYGTNVPVWDPRFYVDSAPLQTLITFDAVDSQGIGINKTFIPPGTQVVQWRWDFGNGENGFGSVSETTYPFTEPPPSVHVTLNTVDNFGRKASCSHPLILLPGFTSSHGGSATRYGG